MEKYDVKDIKLAEGGRLKIEWAELEMPVLAHDPEKICQGKTTGRNSGFCLPACDH